MDCGSFTLMKLQQALKPLATVTPAKAGVQSFQ